MATRNYGLSNLTAGYLFPEIARRRREFSAAHPDAKIISLGIGNTTEPLTAHIDSGLTEGARRLGTASGYSGYGDEQGLTALRERIAAAFYGGKIASDEVFISDGAKCDIGRLQLLFGPEVEVAVQDPSYPVYVDGSVLIGAAGEWTGSGYEGITYLPCVAANGYFPDLSALPEDGIVYFCSPNNPTGAVATRSQLSSLVKAATEKGAIIIYDAAYAEYIRDPALPKSIYEIEGARSCAIEVNSFSKPIGFTGVRLGWTVVPKDLKYSGGESVIEDWNRICTTVFNGASNIAQYGGLAALESAGLKEMRELTDFYLGNAAIIRAALEGLGIACVGGDNAPYIWARFPGRKSWDVFAEILEKCHVVTTPGSGFGPAGESFIRFSAFGHRADVEEACRRLPALRP
ncbi:MAG: LL-diaminopimelate aminotransferase [Treponema sp. GWB1_62_6]|nr:MAG: LL-diaminopimelate aminotransferase [Treponema sp. GWA1_62_8]OHE65486.1 MAG: LL-diaminopimelate aminotransferase [Treponema sp. GWC1_61_84]OHE68396.1 MAG: LL-diaminopimelate aminotransferase [Treponema sp. GWB1_62_6]OHE72523.1 MAG: LL-diaminopimelate aminotransferase [Treponema sp. RIFOXYC1_FULL_61_9]HCM27687.1 LL-diaminopimelate aminotransferase [Treponema sp.]